MCCCCGKEKRIINDYLEAIKKAPEHFPKEITVEKVSYEPSSLGEPDTTTQNNIKDKEEGKLTRRDRLDHYEKLYRCYIDSRRVRLTRWIIIAVAAVMIATIFCCAFGPNFKSQESVNTSSSATTNTVVLGGYADHGSYGYSYFQESDNGR